MSPGKTSARSLGLAALLYFVLVFSAGFVLGVVRVTLAEPRIGQRVAELVEMPVMILVAWLAAGFVRGKYRTLLGTRRRNALVGALALALLVLAEALLVVAQGRDLHDYIAGRDPVSGTAYLVALGLFSAMPWIRHRLA